MRNVYLLKDIDKYGEKLHDFTYKQIKDRPINSFEAHKGVNLMAFDWMDVNRPDRERGEIIIYFSGSEIMFFCENNETYDVVNKITAGIDQKADNETLIYEFFSEVIRDDLDYLDKLEVRVSALEDQVMSSVRHSAAGRIARFRKEVRELNKYYAQLTLITDELINNENGLISDEYEKNFRILDHRIDRAYSYVKELREHVTQVREAYQSQMDIELNNLMKVFTIVSVIFLPLTLLVGWYGMNFRHMPELEWVYAYPAVIIASVAIVLICVLFFKRKKWM